MSDIMEKTLASLPSLLTGGFGNKPATASRPFQNFVKLVGNLSSKHEEEQFVKRELAMQKQKLSQPGVTSGQMREYLVRLVYCHVLGYDVSFAYIHAVKLAQQGSLLEKRAGYLVCSLFLHENHELVMLLVNTIQKDLKSSNVLEVCMALTAVTQLLSTEMIPALLPTVEDKMRHPKDIVRKKTVYCLHSFYLKAPDLLQHVERHFRQALCDKDPSVMWAAVHVFHDLVKMVPASYQDLIPTLVNILQQIISRKLPPEYEYHSIPAPWLQILILKTLSLLGRDNQKNSSVVYPVLKEVLQRIDPSHKIGLAVIYECLETILTVWPHPALVEHAAKCIGKFLSSKTNNLRYLGVKALTLVVGLDPRYALDHQEVVMDCLQHDDHTIRRKTLELLHRMANATNVEVICARLLDNLASSTDTYMQADIISKVTDLTDRFNQNKTWYVDTVNRVMLLAGDKVVLPDSVANRIINLLQDGCELTVVQHAVKTYWSLALQDQLPAGIARVAAWVLGEFSSVSVDVDPGVAVNQLSNMFVKFERDFATQAWILAAIVKMAGHIVSPPELLDNLHCAAHKENAEIQQRLRELEFLLRAPGKVAVLTSPSSTSDLAQLDLSLSFLDDMVAESLEQGSLPYRPLSMRYLQQTSSKETNRVFSGLNFTPYDSPHHSLVASGSSPFSLDKGAEVSSPGSVKSGGTLDNRDRPSLQPKRGMKVWGREGLLRQQESEIKELSLAETDDSDAHIRRRVASPKGEEHQHTEIEDNQEIREEMEGRKALKSALFGGLQESQTKDSTQKVLDGVPLNNPHPQNSSSEVHVASMDLEQVEKLDQGSKNVIPSGASMYSVGADHTHSVGSSLLVSADEQEGHNLNCHQEEIVVMNSSQQLKLLHCNPAIDASLTSMSATGGSDGKQMGDTLTGPGTVDSIAAASIYDNNFNMTDYVDVRAEVACNDEMKSSLLEEEMKYNLLEDHPVHTPWLPSSDQDLAVHEDLPLKLDHAHLDDEDYISIDSLESGNAASKLSQPVQNRIVSIRNTEPLSSMGHSLDSLNSHEGTTTLGGQDEHSLASSLTNLAVIEQDFAHPGSPGKESSALDYTDVSTNSITTVTFNNVPSQTQAAVNVGSNFKDYVKRTFSGFPHEKEMSTLLENSDICINLQKCWKLDCLLIAMLVKWKNPNLPDKAYLEIEPLSLRPQELQVQLLEDSNSDGKVDLIPVSGQCHVLLTVCTDKIQSAMCVCINLLCANQDSVHLELPFTITDFIRPCQISVETYGQLWPKANASHQLHIPAASEDDMKTLVQQLCHHCNAACIQVIDLEGLMCCQILDKSTLCLLHCQMQPKLSSARIWIKSVDTNFMEPFVEHLQSFSACGVNTTTNSDEI